MFSFIFILLFSSFRELLLQIICIFVGVQNIILTKEIRITAVAMLSSLLSLWHFLNSFVVWFFFLNFYHSLYDHTYTRRLGKSHEKYENNTKLHEHTLINLMLVYLTFQLLVIQFFFFPYRALALLLVCVCVFRVSSIFFVFLLSSEKI